MLKNSNAIFNKLLYIKEKNMRFPNAAKGISKLFTSEILSLFALLVLSVSGVIYYATPSLKDYLANETKTFPKTEATACAIFAGIALIMLIIAAIIKIVGIVQAAKDEGAFVAVIYVTIMAIVVSVVISIMSGKYHSEMATGFTNTISNIMSLLTTFLVIGGISNLADQLGDQEIIAKGASIIRKIFWMLVLSVIANIIITFTHGSEGFWTKTAVVLAIIAGLLSFIAYVLYLAYLAKAKKMLQK